VDPQSPDCFKLSFHINTASKFMKPQFQAKLAAFGLFTLSACGTLALFGCVPMLAHLTESLQKTSAYPVQHSAKPNQLPALLPH
jgi:hypothetical protein